MVTSSFPLSDRLALFAAIMPNLEFLLMGRIAERGHSSGWASLGTTRCGC
ncbi:hypothetical protein FHU33_2226 [Blastococcus colisei]|uniref:Uncharacterized protein n=1 Tax=Blastococcus colisei TaxID=1564162 RepID=A0A543PFH5_9ACTN|nr:hypothetical protein FHU33_2226 [Blastococcus colisei]